MIYEFMYRGPIAAENRQAAYHVILAEEVASFGEKKLVTRGPLTPAAAAALGFPLDKILGAIASQAVLERDAALVAKAEAEAKTADAEAAKIAAEAERDVANRDAKTAAKVAMDALDAKVDAEAALVAAEADKAAAQALLAEPEGPKNPALNWITGGLFGN